MGFLTSVSFMDCADTQFLNMCTPVILISSSQAQLLRWPPSETVQTCGRTINAKPEASCQARYMFCHLQPFNCKVSFIQEGSSIPCFHVSLLCVSPHKPEPLLWCPIPYWPFDHTPTQVRVTATVATSSYIKSFLSSPTLLLSAWALPDTPEASPGSWAMWGGALTAERIPATAAM